MSHSRIILGTFLAISILLFLPRTSSAQAAKIIRGVSKVVANSVAKKTATKTIVKAGAALGAGVTAAATGIAAANNGQETTISLNSHTINLEAGSSTLLYVSMNNPDHDDWFYSSNNDAVAIAQWDPGKGAILVKAVGQGTTSIKVQLNGLTDYCQVKVSPSRHSSLSSTSVGYTKQSVSHYTQQQESTTISGKSLMSLSHHTVEMMEGTVLNIKATISNPNNYNWTIGSSDPNVVTWTWDDQAQAITLHANGPGTATITSNLGSNISDHCYVTVYSSNPVVYWNSDAVDVKVGSSAFLSLSAYNPNNDTLLYDFDKEMIDVEWDAANVGFEIKGKRIGKTTMFIELGSSSDVCGITVSPASSLSLGSHSTANYNSSSKTFTLGINETVTSPSVIGGRVEKWEYFGPESEGIFRITQNSITGLSKGSAKVWAYVAGSPGIYTVSVKEDASYSHTKINFDASSKTFTIDINETLTLPYAIGGTIDKWEYFGAESEHIYRIVGKSLTGVSSGSAKVWAYVAGSPALYTISVQGKSSGINRNTPTGLPSASSPTDDNRTISGTVRTAKGIIVIGAAITIKGTTHGAITDTNGHYEIRAKSGDELVVTYQGYTSPNQIVGSFSNVIDFTLIKK